MGNMNTSALQLHAVLAHPEFLELGLSQTLVVDQQGRIRWPLDLAQQKLSDHLLLSSETKELLEKGQNFYGPQVPVVWKGQSLVTKLKGLALWEENQPGAWLLTFDISDQSKEIQALRNRIEDLEKTSVAKSEFLANMSHELRSPLTSIIGMSHMLIETQLDPEQRECAEVITTSSSSLLNLINDTLDISKLDAGKVELEKIPFHLYGLVEQVCRSFLMQTHKKGLHLTIDYHPDLAQQVLGDPGRLRQILTNLVSNAIKFTSEGGVTLTLKKDTSSPKVISIVVSDTGIGIPDKSLAKIFNKFEQADQSTTRRYGGTGLGLAICKELCELMGGSIEVESVAGQGSSFKIEIQLEEQTQNEEFKLTRVGIENKKVLCVDTNPAILKIMCRNLQNSGLECDSATTGAQTLKLLEEAQNNFVPFDAVIMDFQLPDMDGVEMGRQIKNHPCLKNTHLIMLTSMGRKGDSQLVSEAGFEAYLVKPTAHDIILDTLACVLSNYQYQNRELITKYTLSEERASAQQVQGPNQIFSSEQLKSDQDKDASHRQLRILIAEDDTMIQKVLHKLMKKWQYNYVLVENGKMALDFFIQNKPQLILMDWHMPEMDGLAATQKIREHESGHRSTWIIGLTAGGADNVKEKCLIAGMDDHLQKPFDLEVFKSVLQHGLDMAQSLQSS